ncbi:NADH pyrophosphatase [Pacificimonas flava]|uniref:NAD(+) diphosphatase n=3 Tax=Sphingosinicellaceae TaxID=2820280 RepID=A0A219B9U2_9SPHN|nr:NAD(+) diphosphatase [Pacificimonas aurantium]OWV34548.1 NADH pyrophosphatase [Pacificimonas flava]
MPSLFDRPFTPASVGLTGHDFDRADELRRDDEALFAARMHPGARWLMMDELSPHLDADGALVWSRRIDLPDGCESVFLGFEDGVPRFAAAGCCDPDEGQKADARGAAMQLPARDGAIVAQARSLLDWHGRHRFCGSCGSSTELAKGGHARVCAGCSMEHFPRTDPVVIMLAVTDTHALVGRQPGFPAGMMSALAGFVEHGESLEEAVRREILEEAGVRTGRVAYVASQPWPFPYSLMMGAFAEAETTDIRVDEDELEEARWVSKADVASALDGEAEFFLPPPFAIAHTLLRTWADS